MAVPATTAISSIAMFDNEDVGSLRSMCKFVTSVLCVGIARSMLGARDVLGGEEKGGRTRGGRAD